MSHTTYDTLNDLPGDVRSGVITLLNQRLADAVDLQSQAKQAHWNIKGPSFIALHKLFDDIYEAVGGYADLLAERVVQLGGIARGTVRDAAEHSELTDYPEAPLDGATTVTVLAGALADFAARIRTASDEAGELGDQDASDICTEISRGIDKWLWFVEAHVERPRGEASRS